MIRKMNVDGKTHSRPNLRNAMVSALYPYREFRSLNLVCFGCTLPVNCVTSQDIYASNLFVITLTGYIVWVFCSLRPSTYECPSSVTAICRDTNLRSICGYQTSSLNQKAGYENEPYCVRCFWWSFFLAEGASAELALMLCIFSRFGFDPLARAFSLILDEKLLLLDTEVFFILRSLGTVTVSNFLDVCFLPPLTTIEVGPGCF